MSPRLCHSLLQVVPQSDSQASPEEEATPQAVDVIMQGSTDVSALDSLSSNPGFDPRLRHDLSNLKNLNPHGLDLLPTTTLDAVAPTTPISIVGSALDCL